MADRLKKGDRVLISLPPSEHTLQGSALWHFEGMEATISRIKSVKSYTYYELDGAVSGYGIPFGFVKDWLIKVR